MEYQTIHECEAKLYQSGLIVLYKDFCRTIPDRKELKDYANRKRSYRINKNQVRSAAIRAFKLKKTQHMLFLTFTFPFEPTENEAARIWQNMLNNLKTNYHVKYYVWVKERQKSGRLHYHIIIDRNRIGIVAIQNAWNVAIRHHNSDIVCGNNSVRLGPRPVIQNIYKIANYLSKYIAKNNEQNRYSEFDRKAYGFTENMIISTKIDTFILDKLRIKYGITSICRENYYEIHVLNKEFFEDSCDYFENSS